VIVHPKWIGRVIDEIFRKLYEKSSNSFGEISPEFSPTIAGSFPVC
jgi:hypothetical protein